MPVQLNASGVWGSSAFSWDPAVCCSAAITSTAANTFTPTGFTGGGQIGANYQINQFVVGLEGDINYVGLSAGRDVFSVPGATIDHESVQSKWLATFRGRFGFAMDTWLIYATGGFAAGQVKTSDSIDTTPTGGSVFAISSDATRTGWTAGGGIEWALSRAWSIKGEYLHVDLGSIDYTGFTNPAGVNLMVTAHHNFREDIGRVGLNFRVGG